MEAASFRTVMITLTFCLFENSFDNFWFLSIVMSPKIEYKSMSRPSTVNTFL